MLDCSYYEVNSGCYSQATFFQNRKLVFPSASVFVGNTDWDVFAGLQLKHFLKREKFALFYYPETFEHGKFQSIRAIHFGRRDGQSSTESDQSAASHQKSASNISPPEIVPSARHTARSIESETDLVDPSVRATLTMPPAW